ncbi:MAG: type II toxin-antitoxin system VapC family toxin [Symploca sp. SIO2G7]|nr:type II toxin-antitoxin system VapC family toxin [Symploca sp. SIO2G7]
MFTAEVANVLKVQESRKRWTEEQIFEFLSILEKLPLTVEDTSLFDSRTLFTLAKKENLSAYDASYLALALEYNIPLATQDKALKKAATKRKVFFKA